MSERPHTTRLNGSALTILKWVAGIAGGIVVALVVTVIITTGRAVVEHGRRISVVEAKDESRDKSLERIEKKLDDLVSHLMPPPSAPHPRRRR
jgi:hypothetical protein